MAVVLVAAGLLVASLPAFLRPLGRRLPPAQWAQMCLFALVAAVAVVETGLVLLAAPTVLRFLGLGVLADACDEILAPLVPLGAAGGWIAAALATVSTLFAVAALRRSTRQASNLVIEPYLGRHVSLHDHDLVVLPTDARLAYSTDGRRPQVVVSQGLIDALTPSEVDAVLGHETAHLALDHPRMLRVALVARYALAWWPPTGASHAAFRVSIERWADEQAAGAAPANRRCLSTALERVAGVRPSAAAAGFSLAGATAERIDAMVAPVSLSPSMRLLLYVPGAAAGVAAIASLGVLFSDVGHAVAMAGRCPIVIG